MLDRFFIYFPEKTLLESPADVGLKFEDVYFTASDGTRLHGWYMSGQSDTTLVWFHGNAGNIGNRVNNIFLMRERLGVNVFIFDYRGYGQSDGSPSEKGLYLDSEAALDYARSRPDVNADRIVLFGRSLGGAMAVEMATRSPVYGLILESPFTSIAGMAKIKYGAIYPFVPVSAVVSAKYDSLSKIGNVNSPLMILHGSDDTIVPFEMGVELYEAANDPKRFYAIEGADHNDTYVVGGEAYFNALKEFVDGLG